MEPKRQPNNLNVYVRAELQERLNKAIEKLNSLPGPGGITPSFNSSSLICSILDDWLCRNGLPPVNDGTGDDVKGD